MLTFPTTGEHSDTQAEAHPQAASAAEPTDGQTGTPRQAPNEPTESGQGNDGNDTDRYLSKLLNMDGMSFPSSDLDIPDLSFPSLDEFDADGGPKGSEEPDRHGDDHDADASRRAEHGQGHDGSLPSRGRQA